VLGVLGGISGCNSRNSGGSVVYKVGISDDEAWVYGWSGSEGNGVEKSCGMKGGERRNEINKSKEDGPNSHTHTHATVRTPAVHKLFRVALTRPDSIMDKNTAHTPYPC
jgi:hypothetical protein